MFKISSYNCSYCSAYFSSSDAVNRSFRCGNCKTCPICTQSLILKYLRERNLYVYTCAFCRWNVEYTLDSVNNCSEAQTQTFNQLLLMQSSHYNEIAAQSHFEQKVFEKPCFDTFSLTERSQKLLDCVKRFKRGAPPFQSSSFSVEEFEENVFASFPAVFSRA